MSRNQCRRPLMRLAGQVLWLMPYFGWNENFFGLSLDSPRNLPEDLSVPGGVARRVFGLLLLATGSRMCTHFSTGCSTSLLRRDALNQG
jgi:hypothetical protein